VSADPSMYCLSTTKPTTSYNTDTKQRLLHYNLHTTQLTVEIVAQ